MLLRTLTAGALTVCASVQAQTQSADDVRRAFLSAVETCKRAMAAEPERGTQPAANGAGWVSFVVREARIEESDASASSSIMTPWVGWMRLRTAVAVARGDSREAVEGKAPDASVNYTHTVRVAWTDGAWRATTVDTESIFEFSDRPRAQSRPDRLSRPAAQMRSTRLDPGAACVRALLPS